MAKQLNQQVVNFAFTADTAKAKAQIAELYKTLNQVSATSAASPNLFNTEKLKEGVSAAKELQQHLNAAVDVNTGKLNLSAFSASLKSSGKSLADYKAKLEALGPTGENAFLQISKSIATADAPLRKSSTLLKEFSTTLKNTVRWQISSSLLHGFIGSVQSAYGYAQDLNESLNNIRIVTGQNVDQMARFAREANKAAKVLSTTTTAYTDAALIYYQQGLDDTQVKERTDITIKMANVSRQSAQEVSDQMTAVWNNFYDGSQSLEHFADVMTRLGADTASSSDEIAQGLEKFSAIADMIGLSFDNAAAALATVTATTRQSADVVGTAFKTIFARIQGLSLGETLDDGTNLNKYSKALEAVGINIKEQNGELKDMDSILAEMGAKWNTLSKDQQVALAQTVAGVRQYNQLIALMDHFDFYEQNLAAAQNSEGTLQKQADIYAESWEAAQKRVKAAAENIYDSLLDDSFFIKLANGFGILLEGVGGVVDALGGMEGILSLLGGFITQKLAREAPAALETIKQNLMQISGKAHEIANQTQQENIKWLGSESKSSMQTFEEGQGSLAYAAQVSMLEKIAIEKNKLNQYSSQYSQTEKLAAEQEIAHLQETSDLIVAKGQRYDDLNIKSLTIYDAIISKLQQVTNVEGKVYTKNDLIKMIDDMQDASKKIGNFGQLNKIFESMSNTIPKTTKEADQLKTSLLSIGKSARSVSGTERGIFNDLIDQINTVDTSTEAGRQQLLKFGNDLRDKVKGALDSTSKTLEETETEFTNLGNATGITQPQLKVFLNILKEMGIISAEVPTSLTNVGHSISGLKPPVATTSEAIMSFSGALMQANAFISSMRSIKDVFTNEDSTTIEKISAAIGGLTSIYMTLNAVSKLTSTLMATETKNRALNWIVTKLQTLAANRAAKAKAQEAVTSGVSTAATEGETAANLGLLATMPPLLVVTLAITAAFIALATIFWGVTKAIKAFKAASPEGQLKNAQKEAQAFSDALNEAKQEAEDLKNVFDEYESIQEELDKCTKGTEEWTQALSKANNQVLELLSDYPELASMVNENGESAVTNEDGRLKIADWAINNLQEQANQKIIDTQGAYFAAQNVVREKQFQAQKSNVQEDMAKNQSASLQYDTSGYNASNLVSSLILKNQSDFEGKSREEISSNLEQLFNDNGIIASVDSWTDVVLRTQDDFAALNTAIEANTAAAEVQNEALMTSYLQSNQSVQNSEYKDQIISASADQYDKAYKDSYEKWASTNVAGWFGVGTDEGQTLAEKYAEVSDLQGFKVENYRNDQTIDYTYQQEDGTTSEKINISVQAMAEIIAASEALAAVGDNAEALTAKFNQLYTSTDVADHALADFVAYSNLENSTADEVEQLRSAIGEGGERAYLENKLGAENVTDEMVANLEQALSGYDEMVASVGNGLLSAAKTSFDELKDKTSSLSIAGKEAIANTLEQALVYGGEQGLENAKNLISQLNDEDLGEFSKIISNIDWQTMDVDSFNDILQDAGITTQFTSEQLDTFIDSMREVGIASTNTLTDRYSKITKITNGLETGDTISQEDYDTLGEEYQGYFQMMLDGTYKLVGSAEEFQDAVKTIEIGKFQEAMSQITEQNQAFERLKNYDDKDLQQSQSYVNDNGENKYSSSDVNKQLDILDVYGFDPEQIAKWKEDLADNGTTVQVLQDIADAVNEVGYSEEDLTEKIQANNELLASYDMAIANSYTNLKDLKEAYDEGTISAQAYNTVAIQLNETNDTADLDSEEWADYADYIQEAADSMEDFNDNMSDEEAKVVAKGIMKMNDAIDDLANNFDDWKDVLKKSTKGSEEYSKALKGTQKAVSNLLDVSEDYVSDDFIVEHLDDIEKAATGDAEAIDNLKAALAKDIIANIVIENGLDENARAEIIAAAEDLQASIPDIKVGASIDIDNMSADEAAFLEQCNKIIADANMTAEQANAYFDALGFETSFVTEPQTQTQRVPEYVTETVPDGTTTTTDTGPDGNPVTRTWTRTRTRTYQDGYYEASGVVDAIAMATSTDGSTQVPQIKSITKKATGSANNYSSSNSGGKNPGSGGGKGGSSKKSEGKPKKSDVIDRYKEIEDKIDDIRNSADKASNAMDRLFGAKKIQKMQEVNKLLGNEVDLLKAKRNEAEKYLVNDEANLKQAVAKYGGSVKNVELVNGNIDNYEEILSALFDELYAATPKEGAEISDAQQEKIDAIQNRIDKIKEAISQYDETRELIEDLDNEIQDKLYEIQDRNFEILNYKLELKVEVDEAALKRLDYFLNKFSDDFYKMAESAALMQDQIPVYKNLIGSYDEYKTSLDTAYSKGKISQADYIEGLKQVREGIYEQLEALNELDKQMLHYYEDTLSAATDELADHTDHMEHLTSVFEHYQNLLSIIGKSKDYEAMGNFLQGQADTIKDRLSVAQSYYDVLLQQKDEIQAELQAAIASGDKAKIEMYQKEWDAIVDETDAAQEQVLSLTEEWAQAMKSVIQNNMEKIADTLEKTLTGGTTFDTLMDGFDKLNTRQEEYLTKTNQIYETNKLMRTASKALDETDNKVAKQKLKNFIDETKGLQETTQLSKYELEIQQAKYDLLLAQIALEEAQNAKSTVRLSRDNEGNFGYVYTADQNKIDDAQQAVDDADNKLYNLSLEGQQQYTEKYLQAEQAMYEELKQLQQDYLDGNIASEEEYELRKSQIQEHYLGPEGVLTTYSKLYNVAVQTDANATADYWGQEYGRMTQDTETWKTAVNNYLLEIDGQIEEWKNVQTTANSDVGGALNNSKKATEELTTESRNLRDTINDEVIPAISDEIKKVQEQTGAYADQRQKLLDLIATYEDYLKKLDATISVNSIGFDKDTDYSELMNEYLSKGGKTSDNTYKQLLAQRNAKIDWLKTQGKDKNYWGTYGDETTDMYDRLLGGENWTNSKGQDMQKWFTADYVDDSKLTEIFETLGVPIEEIQTLLTDLKTSSDSTGEKIDATKETIQTSTDNINTKISETTESVNTKAGEIGDSINTKVGETTDNLNNTFNETKDILNEDINVFKDETINAFENIGQIIENGVESIVDSVNEAAGEISSSVGSGFSEVRGEISGLQSQINSLRSSQSIYGLASFDTGGYTGNWGPEGKLAMLHEKELILNENDTSNLLSTISFIRELVNMIDAQAASASLFNLMSTPSPNPNANTLEQKVEITAEFPNVNDRYEIEEAFNNLVNRASQYANKAF